MLIESEQSSYQLAKGICFPLKYYDRTIHNLDLSIINPIIGFENNENLLVNLLFSPAS